MMESIFKTPECVQVSTIFSKEYVDLSQCVIILCRSFDALQEMPYGEVLSNRIKGKAQDKHVEIWRSQLPNDVATNVIVCKVFEGKGAFEFTDALTKQLKLLNELSGQILVADFLNTPEYAELSLRTLLAHDARMPCYKSKDESKVGIEKIEIYSANELALEKVQASNSGNALARYLTTLPTNHLTPDIYVEKVKNLAKAEKWGFSFYDTEKLEALEAGAFLAVARASEGSGIVKLRYEPKNKGKSTSEKLVSLVGKGVCFDTGGVSIKSPEYMYGMHEDMSGSAVALGSFLMLSQLNVNYPVECWLAIVDNRVGSQAFLPNEVVKTINGTTIEIVDTDAEGRLILADTLALASQSKPDLMIDFATLTGASIRAVGTRYSTVFSNREDWLMDLVATGRKSGERVWPMPMSDEYLEDIKSEVADIKQCNVVGSGDHIHAAKLLEKFVAKDIRWLHVDMAAGCHKGGLGSVPHDYTGFGVWFTLALLEQRGL